jgi:hypothetical protein
MTGAMFGSPVLGQKPAPPDRHKALALLAKSPDGCTQTMMLIHGFELPFVAQLVREDLVNVQTVRTESGRLLPIMRVKITENGRRVLAELAKAAA